MLASQENVVKKTPEGRAQDTTTIFNIWNVINTELSIGINSWSW